CRPWASAVACYCSRMVAAVSRRSGNRAVLLALSLLLASTLLACADVERTVIDKREPAGEVRTVAWASNRYPDYSAAQVWGPECWNRAVVGEALPDACLTASALASETDPFRRSPWTAGSVALLAIGVLGLVAWRTVGVHPIVARSDTGDSSPSHFDEVAAVSLMQHTESERSARIAAEP